MLAPSGGFSPVGSSTGQGMSVLVFQRTRHAVVGLKSAVNWQPSRSGPVVGVICRSGVMSSMIQKPRPWVRCHEIIVLYDQVADRRDAHVQSQRLPVAAVVERHVDGAFGAGEEKPFAASDPRARR